MVNPDLSDFPSLQAESGFAERKNILFYLLRLTFRSCGLKVHFDSEKKEKNLLDNPKEEKTRFGLVGRKVYRKVFSTFDLLVFDRVFENETRNSQNML